MSFFFSYARNDRDKDPEQNIWKFFKDLDGWVQRLYPNQAGFFDTHGIAAGNDWEAVLRAALRTNRILVPMYSPSYVNSTYCHWEWKIFFDEYQRAKEGQPAAPSTILPIKWLTPIDDLPADYRYFQYSQEDFPDVYKKNDLSQLMSSRKYRDKYSAFVRLFATQLVTMAKRVGNPDRYLPPTPSDATRASGSFGAPSAEFGAQYVRFVLVAGLRQDIVPPRTFSACYGTDLERKDWRPCFPSQDRHVNEIIQEVAENEGRQVRYLAPGPNLLEKIHEAEQNNNIVLLVVDPWSLGIEGLRKLIDDFDKALYGNCGVVVIWNKEDIETMTGKPLLSPQVKSRFDRHIRFTNTFFRDSVMTLEELQQALTDAFRKIRGNLVSEGRAASIPEGMSESQPMVSI